MSNTDVAMFKLEELELDRIRVNFVSNYSQHDAGGGWNGIGEQTYRALSGTFDTEYVGPIAPNTPFLEKVSSKISRSIGRKSTFPHFGDRRLNEVAKEYVKKRNPYARYDQFHGATPWVACEPPVPYGVYIDATFRQYMEVFSNRAKFSASDLKRIEQAEGTFLNNADAIFLGSDWVKKSAVSIYGLDPTKCRIVHTGGKLPIPDNDCFQGGWDFLFVSLDFEGKGGRLAVEAVKNLKSTFEPESKLVIIGDKPPDDVLRLPWVKWTGVLRKSVAEEKRALISYMANARALIHPTRKDTMGLVLIEAAYHGCPAITTRAFGVPEFVLHNETGILFDAPIEQSDVSKALLELCLDEARYQKFRGAAFDHSRQNLSWGAYAERMNSFIQQRLNGDSE